MENNYFTLEQNHIIENATLTIINDGTTYRDYIKPLCKHLAFIMHENGLTKENGSSLFQSIVLIHLVKYYGKKFGEMNGFKDDSPINKKVVVEISEELYLHYLDYISELSQELKASKVA